MDSTVIQLKITDPKQGWLTLWSIFLLEKVTDSQPAKKLPTSMEPGGSLLYTQVYHWTLF